ncbi:MAG TPA: outer membrane lipoprotein-sorting protein [Desulfurivibrio alkaliphilus]|uniref:Outer membrane lipoprotein-sorting protein n=1 Tax=Desulfurivibrio alkaliphilus TaxID=427923 RepID=A0A7C2TH93_9BACT|nr:outer membrane lipoprotein-sorting protein [Desulfurivibrio alkaliphilus]
MNIMPTAVIAALLLFWPATSATAMEVAEIVERANKASYYAGDDGRTEVRMLITDAQGRERERQFVILRKNIEVGGRQLFYVYFERPLDVRRMVFMVHKYLDRDDDRWLFLPDLDLVRRIAASDKRSSFAGSHFLYEDVSGRAPVEDSHQLIEESADYYLLDITPNDPGSVEFSRYTARIDKSSFLPVYMEYFDRQGQKYRTVEALAVEEIQGFPTVIKSRVRDLAGGGETLMEFSNISYNIGLDESLFTERFLRRPPREIRR